MKLARLPHKKQCIQCELLGFSKEYLIPKSIYEEISSSGSRRPRLYGRPKINKNNVTVRPFFSMVSFAQHDLAHDWKAYLNLFYNIPQNNALVTCSPFLG